MSAVKSKKSKSTQDSTPSERIQDLLDKLPAESIKTFLSNMCNEDADVRKKFFAAFEQDKQTLSKAYFEKQMQASMRHSSRYDRYDDFELTHDITDEALEILNQGDECMESGDFQGAMNAATAVLEQMSEAQEEYDDSYGHIGGSIKESMELLKTLTSHAQLPTTVRKELFNYYCTAFEERRFAGWDEDLDMLALASITAATSKEQDRVLVLCDRTCASEYSRVEQEVLAHDIIYNFQGEEAAEAYLQTHLSNRKFRKMAIEAAIENKAYDRAMTLAEEGYQNAHTAAGGPKSEWLEWKLVIAKKQKDKGLMLACTRELFIENVGDVMQHYAQLKKMIPAKEWVAYVEGLIQALKPKPYNSHHAIAKVYVAEGWLDRLIALVQQRNERGFTDTYSTHLSPRYNAELIEIYAGLLMAYLPRCTDRKAYHEAAGYLKRIKALDNGKRLQELVADVKSKYGNRPALLDEVRRV